MDLKDDKRVFYQEPGLKVMGGVMPRFFPVRDRHVTNGFDEALSYQSQSYDDDK
jgi:hypothetical protein